jgi:hypothetical protein
VTAVPVPAAALHAGESVTGAAGCRPVAELVRAVEIAPGYVCLWLERGAARHQVRCDPREVLERVTGGPA